MIWTIRGVLATLACLALVAILAAGGVFGQNYLLDSKGERLSDDQGGFLLAQLDPPPKANPTVLLLQTAGASPNQQTISLTAQHTDAKDGVSFLTLASDPVAKIDKVVIHVGTKDIAVCPGARAASVECRALLPKASMTAGKNDISILVTLGTRAIVRAYTAIQRP